MTIEAYFDGTAVRLFENYIHVIFKHEFCNAKLAKCYCYNNVARASLHPCSEENSKFS